uniref:Si:dkey-92f12.2 n=1 Tax=Astyanax mexicanus TaxID=7994 RepID=A0A8B9JIP8_ASTMX
MIEIFQSGQGYEMLRRSSRLKSKYPSPDEDSTITSSTGSPTQISYRESPVRCVFTVQIFMGLTVCIHKVFTILYAFICLFVYLFIVLGSGLLKLYWWLGPAWYSLIAGISWINIFKPHTECKCAYIVLPLSPSSVHSEHKVMVKELSGIHHQLSDLRSEVSLLRSSSEHFSHRLDTQETQNLRLKKELSDWLLQHVPWLDSSGQDVVMQPELQMALETLEKNIMDKLDKDREKDVGSTVGETLQEEEVRALTIKVCDVKQIVHRALSVFRADGTGMADYALESSGACVINSRCSESYHGQIACFSIFGIPLFYYTNSPRTVIQPELYPGKCWAFRGSEGFLTISLSSPVKITHVTLEHLPRVLSPTGHINSAPKDFAVYGMTDENEGGKLLGRFTYDQEGEPIQTFKIPVSANEVYWLVELRILSNWGNPEYTCIYRFRVHGQPWTS